MTNSTSQDGSSEPGASGEEAEELLHRLPPESLPEELILHRLGRLDTRKNLADLCKNIPGLDEILLPKGIQADALTRKSGARLALLKGISRRITQDPAAWGAFRTAVSDQIPPETVEALEDFSPDKAEELSEAHTTESLLLAALTGEKEPEESTVASLVGLWKEQNQQAEKKATEDAHVEELAARVEELKRENEQLSFASRTSKEQAAALAGEAEVLRRERDKILTAARQAEERAITVTEAQVRRDESIREASSRGNKLERALESERRAYATAAERLEEMHDELGRVAAERDRIKTSLKDVRFTDEGFGELLMRAVKNEVTALPSTVDAAARTSRLLDFMGKVLQAHSDLRATAEPLSELPLTEPPPNPTSADPERMTTGSADSTTANGTAEAAPVRLNPRSRPTLSFKALGSSGQVGGSSHLLDFGRTRILVDAGIKPDGRGPLSPDFASIEGLDGVVITHAHLDHCGALPLLVRDQPDTPIYCTPPSAKLIVAALNDHAAMGAGLPGGAPVHEVKKRLRPIPFSQPLEVGDARVVLTESGHILGAASVLLQSGDATVFHTGDICMEDHFSIPSARLPEVSDIDLLIMEATLADMEPKPFSDSIKTMVETINDTTMKRGGSVLIPTYALGQAQEIILGLKHYGREYGLDRDVFIYVDGSVVTTSERMYAEQLGYMKPYLQHSDPRELFFSENIRAVSNDDKARERILTNPCAIIASPVTMQGGASAFYRKRLEGDALNAVILPSNAAAFYGNHKAAGEEEQWRVERVSFAAHCTQADLLGITEKLTPRQIILIHGSRRRISDLAFQLAPDHKIHTPTVGETVRTIL